MVRNSQNSQNGFQMKLKRGQPQRGFAQEETDYNSVPDVPNINAKKY